MQQNFPQDFADLIPLEIQFWNYFIKALKIGDGATKKNKRLCQETKEIMQERKEGFM